jgi:peptidoglycan/LPS O-acetylase OafA/YrhL
VAAHLISMPSVGGFAVHGFFILSGYLMTHIMINTYGFNTFGMISFAKNRWLRLFPSYYLILIITIIVIYLTGSEITKYKEAIFIPSSLREWVQNLTLVYFNFNPGNESPRLSPPTWALTNEILFYFLICFGISKSKKITYSWLFLSLIYMALTYTLELGHAYRYHVILAASLPFSLGALIYHNKDYLVASTRKASGRTLFILFILFIINSVLYYKLRGSIYSDIFYFLNYLINAAIIIVLIDRGKYIKLDRLDKKIGDYSYPIYLFHWQAGFIASYILFSSPIRGRSVNGVISFLIALLICIALAYITINYIDKPIENYRNRLRKKANKALHRTSR